MYKVHTYIFTLAVDEISLSDDEYFVSESEGEFLVILERRGRLIEPASILLQSRTQFTENAAQGTYNLDVCSHVANFMHTCIEIRMHIHLRGTHTCIYIHT